MSKKNWAEKLLYQEVTSAIPFLKGMKPGLYGEFSLVNSDVDIITIKAQYFLPAFFIGNTEFYTNSVQDFYNEKLGIPKTKIGQIKKAVVKAVMLPLKQIGAPICGVYIDRASLGFLKVGDIKIEITSAISSNNFQEERYGMILNNSEQSLKPLYVTRDNLNYTRRTRKVERKEIYSKLTDEKLLEFLKNAKVISDKKSKGRAY